MGKTMNKELKDWIAANKRIYNILKKLPKKQLYDIAKYSGLDMDYYKTKSSVSKGILCRLGSVLPIEMKGWK